MPLGWILLHSVRPYEVVGDRLILSCCSRETSVTQQPKTQQFDRQSSVLLVVIGMEGWRSRDYNEWETINRRSNGYARFRWQRLASFPLLDCSINCVFVFLRICIELRRLHDHHHHQQQQQQLHHQSTQSICYIHRRLLTCTAQRRNCRSIANVIFFLEIII